MKPPLLLVMIGLVVAITGFVGYNNIYAPHQSQVRLIQNQITEEQTNQTMQADVAALLDKVEQYRKRLPPERDAGWLVNEVLPIAERNGLQLSSIGRDTPQDVGGLTRLSVSLQATGTYHQIGTFVDEIERSEAYLRIDRLALAPSTSAASLDTGLVQLVVSTVYVPPVVNQPR